MQSLQRSIDDMVETVRKAKERAKKCSLLIGAGCSVKANIPTAAGFVNIIKDETGWPAAYKRAKEPKGYPQCMEELSLSERRDLIAGYVDRAKINWAHIAIAQLMQHGYVDRVLTTNFDPLVVRACALVGEHPAVYDFAASQVLKPADIPSKAVFYLHGQRTGFVLMNTKEECEDHSKLLEPLFRDAGQGRVWIVVGYSGESDPVFDHLASVERFDNNLYWIGYKDNEPAAHVRDKLLQNGKYAFHVNGFDADDFFVTLTTRLKCFPPSFLEKPFSHLDGLLDLLTPYKDPNQDEPRDVTKKPRELIQVAINHYEGPFRSRKQRQRLDRPEKEPSLALQVQAAFMAQDYDKVIALLPQGKPVPEDLADNVAWSHVMQGSALADQARTKTGAEADRLWTLADEKYEAALQIKPDMHEALNNWGIALDDQARTKRGAEADRLWTLADEKYEVGLKIKPDMPEAFCNWGNALAAQARTKTGAEADRLWTLADEKYEAALKIKPDMPEAFYNWGYALTDQARTKTGAEADRLLTLAVEKYEAALKIKPDMHEALSGWGNALADQARTKTGAEADRLFTLAGEKYEAALKIKPDMHEAFCNWGNALANQARTKTGAEADRLFTLAGEKYEAALKIKPDMHEALSGWGGVLISQGATKSGPEAERLFNQGREKALAAEGLSPGASSYNLACAFARLGQESSCREWLEKCKAQGKLPSADHIRNDPDLAGVREREWFEKFLASL